MIQEAIRNHGRPLACALEWDELPRLVKGPTKAVAHSISQLIHLDKIIVYVALAE